MKLTDAQIRYALKCIQKRDAIPTIAQNAAKFKVATSTLWVAVKELENKFDGKQKTA